MSIGYACLALGVYHSNYRTFRLDKYNEDKLKELIVYNLESLNRIIDYNIENEINLFRISSDLIPFGSSSINQLKWWDIFQKEFQIIGSKIKKHNIKVSMHPGQYTVLNSPKKDVVKRSIDDLIYHTLVLDCLQVDHTCKVVVHIGGVYGDKKDSMNRFIQNFQKLPLAVKRRLIIENDDRNYNIEDVLHISNQISIPVVFDNLHHFLNPPERDLSDSEWINICKKTWKNEDGKQKVHYSEQDPVKQVGAHSFTINHELFLQWYKKLDNKDIDVMLEVKDKNISALKISHCVNQNLKNKSLEISWEKYKYKVLEHSPVIHDQIIELLKSKKCTALDFYQLIDLSLKQKLVLSNQISTVIQVWNNYEQDKKTKSAFLKRLKKVEDGSMSIKLMKNYLYNLAVKNQDAYLLSSYYFAF